MRTWNFKLLFVFLACLLLCAKAVAEENIPPATSVTPAKKLKPFTAVELSGVGDLYIKQTAEESVTVEAGEDLLPLITIEVRNKTLYLGLKNASSHTQAKIKFNLNIKELNRIVSTSTSSIHIEEPLKTATLNIFVGGLGEATLNLKVDKLIAEIDGGGKMTLVGTASEQALEIRGAGEFDGEKLLSKTAKVYVSGSGIAKVNAAESLDITALDDGIVKYCAKPKISKQLSDSALVMALGKIDCEE